MLRYAATCDLKCDYEYITLITDPEAMSVNQDSW